ncbi:hypothetical protein SELMODRAFT_409593 [Selaginella moellendorffii]|uniref:Uncharacterized protein n=1 Tax=Selaginella moellendorffii TaxID=88036 RepID=D8RBY2_SELML|nr:hypothetical protein SELMODRAFT_409593 [Selaginella moellendorffii]
MHRPASARSRHCIRSRKSRLWWRRRCEESLTGTPIARPALAVEFLAAALSDGRFRSIPGRRLEKGPDLAEAEVPGVFDRPLEKGVEPWSRSFVFYADGFAGALGAVSLPNRRQPDVQFYRANNLGWMGYAASGVIEVGNTQSFSNLLNRCETILQTSPNFVIGLKFWDRSTDRMVYSENQLGIPNPHYGFSFGPRGHRLSARTYSALEAHGFDPTDANVWSGVEVGDAPCTA